MKRFVSTILLLSLLFLSVSCGGAENVITDTAITAQTEQSTEFKPYKYGVTPGDYMFGFNSRGVIVKYNVHNGQSSYLCPDPFCTHTKSTCQFSGLGSHNYTSVGNTVYYVKQDSETGKSALYAFDIGNSETKTVFTRDGMMTGVYAYEKRLLVLWLEKFDFEAERYYFWYDIKTGKTEKLSDEVNVMKPYETRFVYYIRDDRIIWTVHTPDGTSYKSTDLKGEDMREHDFGYRYGNYYKTVIEPTDDGQDAFSLYVTFAGETEPKRILQGAGPILFYENKIVYFGSIPEEDQKIIKEYKDGRVIRDEFGGNVYVMNPDGSDAHLLFHTDELLCGTTDDEHHPLVCGDYIGILTGRFKGDQIAMDDIIIANVNTGEFVVIHD